MSGKAPGPGPAMGEFNPGQEVLARNCLRPGNNVDLVLERNERREVALVRRSLLYEIKGRFLLLAQVNPQLGRASKGLPLEVTFLNRYRGQAGQGAVWLRAGYYTTLADVVPNYDLGNGVRESALVVPVPQQLEPVSVRMHHRMSPPLDLGLKALMAGGGAPRDEAGVVNISLGGARLVYPRQLSLSHQEELKLVLRWADGLAVLTARVVRQERVQGREGRSGSLIALQFMETDPGRRRLLAGLLARMEREEIARRAAWLEEWEGA